MQRYDGNTKPRLSGANVYGSCPGCLSNRDDLHQITLVDDGSVRHAQDAFEDREHVLARNWAGRSQSHVALYPRINHKVNSKRVAQHGLSNVVNVGAVKVELHTVAPNERGIIR